MSDHKKMPEYLYIPENCPCPRGEQAGCPNYRQCEKCTANHHGKGGRCACEKKAAEEGFTPEEMSARYAELFPEK